MFNIIINLLIILVGVTFIFLGIYGSHKKVMELHIKDKGILEKYLKSQRLLLSFSRKRGHLRVRYFL